MKTMDADLWLLFMKCSDGTRDCQKCEYNNQRIDGYCCSLVDDISLKLEENKNGIEN